MSNKITFKDIQDNTNEEIYSNPSTKENELIIPKKLGQGKISQFSLSDGISIHNIDMKVKEDFVLENRFEQKMFAFSGFLHGNLYYKNNDFNINKTFKNNFLNITALNCENGSSYYKKNQHIKAVNIILDNEFIINYIKDDNNSNLYNTLEKLETKPHFEILKESACSFETKKILNDIYSLDFNNNLQKLAIKSSIYELLFNSFTNLNKNDVFIPETEKFYLLKVKEFILDNLYTNLNLKDLSKVASTNETKLQKNFKIFFGTTVFKYILNERLKKSKKLLETNEYSVFEIAKLVGYNHQSNFSTAFFKKYGLLPKDINK